MSYQDEKGEKQKIFMGVMGLDLGRLMGTVVEALSDDKGIIWPETIAPFPVHLLLLGEDEKVSKEAEKVYESLEKAGVEVLFDDRAEIIGGRKIFRCGLAWVFLIARLFPLRSLKEGGIELKKRTEEKGKIVSLDELLKVLFKK